MASKSAETKKPAKGARSASKATKAVSDRRKPANGPTEAKGAKAKKPAPAKAAATKSVKPVAKAASKTPSRASKSAVGKASGKQVAKPAAKTSSKAPAPSAKKATEKPAAKVARKAPEPKVVKPKSAPTSGKPEAKPASARTAPPAPDPEDVKTVEAPKRTAPSKKAAKAAKVQTAPAAPPAPKKKLNVGQKPRSDQAAPILLTTQTPAKESEGAVEAASKTSPASKEAKLAFKVNDSIVYPAHGVGRIVAIERQQIAGVTNELFVIDFEQEKMKLRVPTAKAASVGMRGLSDEKQIALAIDTLKGRARVKRTMWSRRAQEYEAKINSGDVMAVAEVVRDLYRASDQPEQSYSERQLFEAALDRLAREVAAVRKSDLAKAISELEGALQQKRAA